MTDPATTAAFRARVLDALCGRDADATCWAVLDAARDARVLPALRRTVGTSGCLYAGKLAPEVEDVAPYLVPLRRDDALAAFLIDAGWGESWGVFFRSGAAFEPLRRHLRRFLKVRTWDGRGLLFRFYDPRVLRTYLPTCTADEAATFFGPIDDFALEAADASAVLEFSRAQHGVVRRELAVGAPPPRGQGGVDVRAYVGRASS